MKKSLLTIGKLIIIFLAIWVIFSFIDVNMCNDITSQKDFASWNMFALL